MQLQLFHTRINKWKILQLVEILQLSVALFSYYIYIYIYIEK